MAAVELGSVTPCAKSAEGTLGLSEADYCGEGKTIQGPNGLGQLVQTANLALTLGDATKGAAELCAEVCLGHPILQKLGSGPDAPAAILGMDILRRSRFVLSPRSSCLWLSS